MVGIFLSWNGDAGREIAKTLRDLLPIYLHGSSPFMSEIDIEKGSQWRDTLDSILRETSYGMFILTPENTVQVSEWMAYEAGAAIATKGKKINVCTLLFDVQPTSMPQYLVNFQFSSFQEEDWKKLFRQIYDELQHNFEEPNIKGNRSEQFDRAFNLFWEYFRKKVESTLQEIKPSSKDSVHDENWRDGKAFSINDPEMIKVERALHEFSSFVAKIPSIETKIDDLFNQVINFQSRLAPPLRETGLLTSGKSNSGSKDRYDPSSLRRLQNIVISIERDGLLDDENLKELKSALEELT
ncbi:MAG: TIR domain-containing protein [Symploca sp. SIO3E6]|nr:TIR domain-containing protein [Caldora sp. SIO3E6]